MTGEVSSYLSFNLLVRLESFDKDALDRKRAEWVPLASKTGTPEPPKDKADQDRAENEGMPALGEEEGVKKRTQEPAHSRGCDPSKAIGASLGDLTTAPEMVAPPPREQTRPKPQQELLDRWKT